MALWVEHVELQFEVVGICWKYADFLAFIRWDIPSLNFYGPHDLT
jgi:hypothetical protein